MKYRIIKTPDDCWPYAVERHNWFLGWRAFDWAESVEEAKAYIEREKSRGQPREVVYEEGP